MLEDDVLQHGIPEVYIYNLTTFTTYVLGGSPSSPALSSPSASCVLPYNSIILSTGLRQPLHRHPLQLIPAAKQGHRWPRHVRGIAAALVKPHRQWRRVAASTGRC